MSEKCALDLGLTGTQIRLLLGTDENKAKFDSWMEGQTLAWCSCHGPIYYAHDLVRYLRGLPVID